MQGQDMHPKTLNAAYNMITHWKQERDRTLDAPPRADRNGRDRQRGTPTIDGASFNTEGRVITNRNGRPIMCYTCGGNHYASDCPEGDNSNTTEQQHTTVGGREQREQNGRQFLTDASSSNDAANSGNLIFDRGDDTDELAFCTTCTSSANNEAVLHTSLRRDIDKQMPSTWMLIDSQATCDVFCNKSLLTNIRDASCTLNIHTNTGVGQTTLIGDLRGYGTVWYYPKGIANILSLAKVAERYRVTYDSLDGYFVVHKSNGKKVIFKKCAKGLHYNDVKLAQTQDGTALLTTVEQNKLQYHPRDVKQAELARQIQKIIG